MTEGAAMSDGKITMLKYVLRLAVKFPDGSNIVYSMRYKRGNFAGAEFKYTGNIKVEELYLAFNNFHDKQRNGALNVNWMKMVKDEMEKFSSLQQFISEWKP